MSSERHRSSDPGLRDVLHRLAAWGSAREWIGPDPYEGLNAPIAAALRGSKRARQAAIQVNRRSPVPLPWPLRSTSAASAKVAGLVLSGYAQPAASELPDAVTTPQAMVKRLQGLRLEQDNAWGYHFDVQTRSIYYERSAPNAISTCFAVRGLLDAREGIAMALAAKPFLLSLVQESEHGPFFGYVSAGSELIHNANLMACGTLARLLEIEPDDEAGALIEAATQTSIGLRRDDGNWPYGERGDLAWRDNFHTAYMLEGIARVAVWSGAYRELLLDATDRWLEAFVDDRATATFHPHRRFPADTHSAATAIDTLCVVADVLDSERERLRETARAVAERAIELLWLEREGRFATQVNARWVNRREFMRWTNAPMFSALCRVLGE